MAFNQKQAKELREKLFEQMKFDGFTVEGRTKEGLALADENQNIIIIKIVAKKDDFDLADALEEFEEAEAKAREKGLVKEAKKKEEE